MLRVRLGTPRVVTEAGTTNRTCLPVTRPSAACPPEGGLCDRYPNSWLLNGHLSPVFAADTNH